MSGSAHISDLTTQLGRGPRWAMVRIHFGISSFGVNAYIADEAGVDVIGEHDEVGPQASHHEELYFVADGHATFTVNGDEIDAPAGTFVFVRDPAAKRKAVAQQPGTTILIAGGRAGEAFTPSSWERQGPILNFFATKEYDKAVEGLERMLDETPDDATVLYNLACALAQTGKTGGAIERLGRAIELDERFRDYAKTDPDFDAIRDEAEFASAIAGQAGARSSGS